ncbi:uncharacterized protein LOC114255829 [Camellia sinensis]|uniref:uncharacterized protein LOC114255829 n=1 Tax=Camellia sinensis TaxID=4442 RepID=UPI001035B4A7|nr:uncharacterized protein LOC114255829 [Camellia sinensis]
MYPMLSFDNLEEDVFMSQPPGFVHSQFPIYVCKLNKSLDGLKQAPRAWFFTFSNFLLTLGFVNSHCDNSLFVQATSALLTYLLVYVDDILITGSSLSHLKYLITQLHSAFSLKELGNLPYFFGISVTSTSSSYFLSQSQYASTLLKRAGMTYCKPASSPLSAKPTVSSSDVPFTNPAVYRSLVGGLQYLTITRPDLAFAVNQACQYMHNPSQAHFALVKRLLRFVKGSLQCGLTFSSGAFDLHVFSDAVWAGSPCDRRSTFDFCIFLGSNLVSWAAKKQPTVARSSTDAEYRAMALASAEVAWLQMLLKDMHICPSSVPVLWCDNLSTLSLAANLVFYARTKHIEINYHFVCEKGSTKQLLIRYVASSDQLEGD